MFFLGPLMLGVGVGGLAILRLQNMWKSDKATKPVEVKPEPERKYFTIPGAPLEPERKYATIPGAPRRRRVR